LAKVRNTKSNAYIRNDKRTLLRIISNQRTEFIIANSCYTILSLTGIFQRATAFVDAGVHVKVSFLWSSSKRLLHQSVCLPDWPESYFGKCSEIEYFIL